MAGTGIATEAIWRDLPGGYRLEYEHNPKHAYWLHRPEGGRERLVSVSTVAKVLDKPGLLKWAQATGVAGAIELASDGNLPPEVPDALKRMHDLGLTMEAKRDAGGDKGTEVHDVWEAWMVEGRRPDTWDFADDRAGRIEALQNFVDDLKPEAVSVEQIVASVKHKFAGRYDGVVLIDGERVRLDLKTTRSVYASEHFPQLDLYEVAARECGEPACDALLVVLLNDDGRYVSARAKPHPNRGLAYLRVYRAKAEYERDYRASLKEAK